MCHASPMLEAIPQGSEPFEAPGRLVSLAVRHEQALEAFLREFDAVPDELHGYFCHRDDSIEQAVSSLGGWSRGERLKEGWVPSSTWFWEVGETLQGVINVRHRLTPSLEKFGGHIGYAVASSHRRQGVATAMLGAVLGGCRELGLLRALLNCDFDNLASVRTIEANGGALDREGWSESARRMQRWYWIDLNG